MARKFDVPVQTQNVSPEFDAFAENYNAGMDNPLKRFAGGSADDFIELKVRWFLKDLARHPIFPIPVSRSVQVLDYGCGAGTFLRLLHRLEFSGMLHGCDLSPAMIEEARRTWQEAVVPQFQILHGNKLPYPDRAFDVVIMCALLHHVAPTERPQVIDEGMRVLRPNGRLYLFEHNPWNPVTSYVVRHTPIDSNAILLSSRESRGLLRSAGFGQIRTRYMMFFPPRWKGMRGLETLLSRVPLGGQFVVTGNRP